MIFKTKIEIFNWLKQNDNQYQVNIANNAYELIDLHDDINQYLFNEMIKKDNLPSNYFENLKKEGHQYIVNVKDSINLYNKKLIEIPIQFYQIDKNFYCHHNQLISLKGCPHSIGLHFILCSNKLTSLKYCPQKIGGDCDFSYNQLTSLEYCPHFINGFFDCSDNQLTSLRYSPDYVGLVLFCHNNKINSLEYFPEIVKGVISIGNNTELLKYKHSSHDIHIQTMSDFDFLNKRIFKFWQQFYLEEQIKKQNHDILVNLEIVDENFKKNRVFKV